MTIEHPGWCSLPLCDATDSAVPTDGGVHRSEPTSIDLTYGFGPIRSVAASLTQAACPWTTDTYLILRSEQGEMSLPVREANAALFALTALVRQADVR